MLNSKCNCFNFPISDFLFSKMSSRIYENIQENLKWRLEKIAVSDNKKINRIISELPAFDFWLDFENKYGLAEAIVKENVEEVSVETIQEELQQYIENQNDLEDFLNSAAYEELVVKILSELDDCMPPMSFVVQDFYSMIIDTSLQKITPFDFYKMIDKNKVFNFLAEHIFEDAGSIFRKTYFEISEYVEEKIEEVVDEEIENLAIMYNYHEDCVSEFINSGEYRELIQKIELDVCEFIEDRLEDLVKAAF